MTGESSDRSSASVAIRSYSDGPPWIFKGRALYQLHAVKSSVARRFIPPELKLVEAFGYTLGGLFLAHYDGSPAGEFDEAVVIAGIVWNAPTSCAWAGRVLVGSEEARIHGRQEVGLPSHFASFSHQSTTSSHPHPSRPWWDARSWLSRAAPKRAPKVQHSVEIVQRGAITAPLCQIVGIPRIRTNDLPSSSLPAENQPRLKGPSVQLYLPNFSGKTKEQPKLLKYSCALNCRVSVVTPARVIDTASNRPLARGGAGEDVDGGRTRDVVAILNGKPLASIFFDQMVMHVEAPTVASEDNKDRRKQKVIEPTGDFGLASSAGPAS